MRCSGWGLLVCGPGSAVYNTYSAAPVIVNAIFWANGLDEIVTEPTATSTVTRSCVAGGHPGDGNIDADPLFADASNGDVRLLAGSPCIDTGTASGAPAEDIRGISRPQHAGIDMGAHEFVNAAPVIDQGAGPLAVTMSEDGVPTPWSAPALSATDPDASDTLTWSLISPASHGTAAISGTGTSPAECIYAPESNWHGVDSFTVQVSDGTASDTIEIEVTVESVPDPDDGDNDGLTDDEEYELGTEPDDPDSDDDGWSDGDEAAAGTNPLDDASVPVSVVISGPSAVEVLSGGNHAFEALVSGGQGEIHYQWFFEPEHGAKLFSALPQQTESTLFLTDITEQDAGFYKCQVWGDVTAAESDTVQLIVTAGVPTVTVAGLIVLAGTILLSGAWVERRDARRRRV